MNKTPPNSERNKRINSCTVLALIVSTAFGLLVYLLFFQRSVFSKSYFLYSLIITLSAFLIIKLVNRKVLSWFKQIESTSTRITVIVLSLVIGAGCLANSTVVPLYDILPDTTLQVAIPIIENAQPESATRLLGIKNSFGYIHFSNFEISGEWEQVGKNLVFSGNQPGTIQWNGKAWQELTLFFASSVTDQFIEIIVNGARTSVNINAAQNDLYDPDNNRIIAPVAVKTANPVVYLLLYMLAFMLSVGYAIFGLITALSRLEFKNRKKSGSNNLSWLVFMLPMLLAWGFTLFIYWPGIMSNDSLAQWAQGATGQFNDWQSGFHALLMAGLMRVWYSPALIAILQVIGMACVIAWGMDALDKQGAPRPVLWALSLLFAALPVNAILSITLWKDIPYAIAFLWLTVMVTKIVLSRGEWIRTGYHWLLLGLAAFLVVIFRHNGIAVAGLSLIILLLVYRRLWKPMLGTCLVAVLLFLGVKGPLYSAFSMDRTTTGQTNLIYLHHIAAHVSAGTQLETQERDYLAQFMPLDEWDYWCCYVGPISYNEDFKRQSFLQNTSRNRVLAFSLFKREPKVDISHAFCACELAWRFENNECYMKSTHGFSAWIPGETSWIVENGFDLKEYSLLPGLVDPFVLYLRNFGFPDDMLVFWLRPAFWLLLAAFSTAVLAIRRRDIHILLALLPAVSQTVVLILVSFAPAYRYHYGTFLAGVFLMGLLFTSNSQSKKT